MAPPFRPNYWGKLPQFEIPHSIVQDGILKVNPDALAVLLVLFEVGKAQQRTRTGSTVQVKVTHDLLMERSGYSKNVIPEAVKELEERDFIRCSASRKKRGEFGSNVYTLLNPGTGIALAAIGRNILYSNEVQYIKVPVCVVKELGAEWSIAKMSGSELRLYVSICWLANRKNSEFDAPIGELKKLGGFSTSKTAETARDGLVDKSLVSVAGDKMVLHDPYTGEPLHVEDGDPQSDPANYYTTTGRSGETRWNINTGNPQHIEQLLRTCDLDPIEQNDGELAILCPFHAENTPSCFVNPKKRVFYCHGCTARGTLTQLIMKVRAVDKGTAWKLVGESSGQTVEFHQPDKNAEAIYSYHDAKRVLRKQVLRYPEKKFKQRRPGRSGGWIWDVKGVPTLLYNLDRLKYASIVCVCEGEKDCESIKAFKLYDARGGDVVATTSGNAESWRDQLADHLIGKRVVLMPDADEPGERYGVEVEASLKARGIEYRVVSFGDAGAKDVSEFEANGGTMENIVDRVGRDWVRVNAPSPLDLDDEDDLPLVTP
jgi:hypothetical protein